MNTTIDFFSSIYDGEMLPFERYRLYNWISEIKPSIIFEVGTGMGGGSTYFISESIKNHGITSIVHTCDPLRSPSEKFLYDYPFVKYYKENSDIMLKKLISDKVKPNFIMFDGPENPDIALNDLIFLEDKIDDGTFFCMHDWDHYRDYDKNYSTKSIKVRKYIEESKNWILVEQLFSNKKNSNFDTKEFDSVGLCLYKFKK